MAATAYWETRVLDAVFNGVAFSVDRTYVGLAVNNTEVYPVEYIELIHSDYSRREVEWSLAEDGAIHNTNRIVWSPTTNWGTIPTIFISDVAQGGEMLFTAGISVNSGAGSKIVIEVGDLTVT